MAICREKASARQRAILKASVKSPSTRRLTSKMPRKRLRRLSSVAEDVAVAAAEAVVAAAEVAAEVAAEAADLAVALTDGDVASEECAAATEVAVAAALVAAAAGASMDAPTQEMVVSTLLTSESKAKSTSEVPTSTTTANGSVTAPSAVSATKPLNQTLSSMTVTTLIRPTSTPEP